MEQDHIISEVRKNREELLSKFDYDLEKLYEYIKAQEKKSGAKLMNFQRKATKSARK